MLTTVTYAPGRLLKALRLQIGGFTNAVVLSDVDFHGPTNKRHHGTDAAKFGDGYGSSGGRVVLPVRIISKPTPEYTDQGRSEKIEGEVIVEVMFCASGHLEVLGIVQPLGHGLDESAVEAVQGIKFRPASVNGHAVDFRGRAHVFFELIPEIHNAGPPGWDQ